ncbi:MAG: 6-carboxytetrahydropterin synthase QueD [Chloroflexi bacterium]|nr:6-carboxytetrahydropterin synthase QueD [Chloroflexota bacterium]
MYEVAVEADFDAAHYLRGYEGKCENVHGHRFRVKARVRTKGTDAVGMAYDFTKLRRQLGEVVGRLDHVCLNETPPFDKINPSSENIASTIFAELQGMLGGRGLRLHSIQVWESPHSSVVYQPDEAD